MKKIFILLILILHNISSQAQCANGGAELNNFSGWKGYTGANSGGNLNLSGFTPGIVPGRHSIVTAGANDPIVGAPMPLTASGSNAFRLGNTTGSTEAEILSFTFTAFGDFPFMYATVLQGAHTDPTENGFFSYWLSTSSDLASSTAPGNLIIGPQKIMGDATDPFFQTMLYNGEPLAYKEWHEECLQIPTSYMGQELTVYFATADCRYNVHFGYAYIDALCLGVASVPAFTGPDVVCNIDDPITFDGSSTLNETDYKWSMVKCDAAGNAIGLSKETPIVTGLAGTFDAKSLWGAGNIESGAYYKITLWTRSCSGGWITASRIVQIKYPEIEAFNKVICCGSPVQLSARIIQTGPPIMYFPTAYKWYDEAGNYLGNGTIGGGLGIPADLNNITVTPARCTKYRIVFEAGGCKNEKWIYVTTVSGVPGGKIECGSYNNCSGTGTVKFTPDVRICGKLGQIQDYDFHMNAARNNFTYSWSSGVTNSSASVIGNNTYTLTVTNACGSNTFTVKPPKFTGAFPNLYIPNGMSATNPFVIYNTLLAASAVPAYNAYAFDLRIFDRWGNLVYEIHPTTCLGFYNGQIRWDGRDMNGNLVNIPAVYNYELILRNCNGGQQQYKGDISFIQ